MQATGEASELGQGGLQLSRRVGDGRRDLGVSVRGPDSGRLQEEGDGHELLLRAVVDVALDPPPLGVAGGHDSRSGLSDLLELGADVGGEPLVLEGESRSGRDRPDELGLLDERRVVDQRSDRSAADLEPRHGAPPVVRPR